MNDRISLIFQMNVINSNSNNFYMSQMIEYQKLLFSLKKENFQEILFQICASNLIQTEEGLSFIWRSFILISTIRINSIEIISNFCHELIKHQTPSNFLNSFISIGIREFQQNNYILFQALPLIAKLWDSNFFSFSNIQCILQNAINNHLSDQEKFQIIYWFAPEIQNSCHDLSKFMFEHITNSAIPTFNQLSFDNWSLLKRRRIEGCNPTPMAVALREDNILYLKNYAREVDIQSGVNFPPENDLQHSLNQTSDSNIKEKGNIDKSKGNVSSDTVEDLPALTFSEGFDPQLSLQSSPYEFIPLLQGKIPILNYASFYGAVHCISFLLTRGINSYFIKSLPFNEKPFENPVHFAIAGGHSNVLDLFEGENFYTLEGCLHIAVLYHQNDIFLHLLPQKDFKFDEIYKFEGTVLHAAARANNLSIIKYCLQNNADINATTNEIRTPLHYAVMNGSYEAVAFLASYPGCNVNAKDIFNESPVMIAIKMRFSMIAKLLLNNLEVDRSITNSDERTLYHFAAKNGNLDILQLLKDDKVHFSEKDHDGNTPLHIAAAFGNVAAFKLFCINDKLCHIQNNKKKTPLQLAEPFPEIIKYINKKQEDKN